jgi:cytosolic iron-sulfur protein assembly protein CIAO1
LRTTLRGHEGAVWCVAWSPRGLLASCGADKKVRVYCHVDKDPDAANDSVSTRSGVGWQCIASISGKSFLRTVRSVAWGMDGRSLAAACFDATATVLELVGGEVPKIEVAVSLEGHESELKGVAYSSSGGLLATCSRDRSVWIWEVGFDYDYECIAVLNGHTADVKCVRWHPSQELLVSGSYDNDIKVWVEDEDDWFCLETLSAHDSTVWSMSFNGDGGYLVSVGDGGAVVIWKRIEPPVQIVGDYAKYCVVAHLADVHDGTIFGVDWEPSRDAIATCGGDDAIRILRRRPKNEFPVGSSASAGSQPGVVQSSVDSNGFSEVGDDQINDLPTREKGPAALRTETDEYWIVDATVCRAHRGDVNCVAWSPENRSLLASCGDDGLVRLWVYEEEELSAI